MAGRNKVIFALVDGKFSEWGNKLRSTEKTIPSLYANTMVYPVGMKKKG